MYDMWAIENYRDECIKKIYNKILQCGEENVFDELEHNGIKVDELSNSDLWMMAKEYDVEL
mgnify:CR=1 FL=1